LFLFRGLPAAMDLAQKPVEVGHRLAGSRPAPRTQGPAGLAILFVFPAANQGANNPYGDSDDRNEPDVPVAHGSPTILSFESIMSKSRIKCATAWSRPANSQILPLLFSTGRDQAVPPPTLLDRCP
jgi:hypothetical protein